MLTKEFGDFQNVDKQIAYPLSILIFDFNIKKTFCSNFYRQNNLKIGSLLTFARDIAV